MALFIGCGAIITRGDKYVLIEEDRAEKRGLLNLPAGSLERDEDVVACTRREVLEEVGTPVELESFVGCYQTLLSTGDNILFLVFSGTVAMDAKMDLSQHKISTLTYHELERLEVAGRMRSPSVMQAVRDHHQRRHYPLDLFHCNKLRDLSSITVSG